MATSLKISGKELVHYLAGCILVYETTWHYQHVGIVVLPRKVRNLRHPHKSRPDFLMLVESHAYALATATDSNAHGICTVVNRLAQPMRKVRIVATLLIVSAEAKP